MHRSSVTPIHRLWLAGGVATVLTALATPHSFGALFHHNKWSGYKYAAGSHKRLVRKRRQSGGGSGGSKTPSLGAWSPLGPLNFTNHYQTAYGLGAMIGRVNAVAFDPTNRAVRYAASAGGGLWRSADFGNSWTAISLGLPHLQISAVAVDPNNPGTVYVGLGDADNADPSQSVYTGGVWVTTTAAARTSTWTHLGDASLDGLTVTRILVDPDNSKSVLVATRQGASAAGSLFRYDATNGKLTNAWTKAVPTPGVFTDLQAGIKSASGVRNFYAVGTYAASSGSLLLGVWKSTDTINWVRTASPSPQSGAPYRVAVAASPTDAQTVYVASAFANRVFVSHNAGLTWADITAGFPTADVNGQPIWPHSATGFFLRAGVYSADGSPADMLALGLDDIYTLPTAGGQWQAINGTYSGNDLIHYDQHAGEFDPAAPTSLLVGNGGGAYYLSYSAGANAWSPTSLNGTLNIGQVNAAAYVPGSPNIASVGLVENGTALSYMVTDPTQWSLVSGGNSTLGGSGGGTVFSPLDSTVVFTTAVGPATPGGAKVLDVYRNGVDTGLTSIDTGDTVGTSAPMATSANNPDMIYTATNFLYVWNDSLASWTKISPALSSGAYVTSIAVSPTDDNRIYTGSADGQIWITTDGGFTWAQLPNGSMPAAPVRTISINPANENDIVVGLASNGASNVWELNTNTASATFLPISGSGANVLPAGVPVNSVSRDTMFGGVYYAGTDIGVYYSPDAGANWFAGPTGLPNVIVKDIQAVSGASTSTPDYLYSGTYGLGVWRYPLADTGKLIATTVAPNPDQGGSACTGYVELDGVQRHKASIGLTSSNPAVAQVPAAVTIPAGASYVPYTITTSPVDTPTTVTITARQGTTTVSTQLTVIPPKTVTALTIVPPTISAGYTAVGQVTLSAPAGPSGVSVSLSASGTGLKLPRAVLVPANSASASFNIGTSPLSSVQTYTVTATYAGASQSATLTVNPILFSSLTVAPAAVTNGYTSTGTVKIGTPAPPEGVVITLSSSIPAAQVPSSVTIKSGLTTASFQITTSLVAAPATATIAGTYAGEPAQTATLVINPVTLSALTVNPSTTAFGIPTTGTVTINTAAPPAGTTITLKSSNPGAATVPATVTIPSGQTTASFPVTPLQVSGTQTSVITATYTAGGVTQTQSATVTVDQLALVTLAFNPNPVYGGTTTTGTVTLNGHAPAAVTVHLSGNYPDAFKLPASVVIPKGAQSVTFQVPTTPVLQTSNFTVDATSGYGSTKVKVTITAAKLDSLMLSPDTVSYGSGEQSVGTVSLSGPAPLAVTVTLASSNTAVAKCPATVVIPAGQTSATFQVVPGKVSKTGTSTITASYAGVTTTAVLTVTP